MLTEASVKLIESGQPRVIMDPQKDKEVTAFIDPPRGTMLTSEKESHDQLVPKADILEWDTTMFLSPCRSVQCPEECAY